MKNLFELRRAKKVKYKGDKEAAREYYRKKGKAKAKIEHKKAMEKKRVISRILPSIVADNFDRFMELAPQGSSFNLEAESDRVRGYLLGKN